MDTARATCRRSTPSNTRCPLGDLVVKVRIPTPLRSYTDQRAVVNAAVGVDGATIDAVLHDLDRQFPGLRFRMVDEQGRLRQHMKVFVNDEATRVLDDRVMDSDEITVMQALSGGCPLVPGRVSCHLVQTSR